MRAGAGRPSFQETIITWNFSWFLPHGRTWAFHYDTISCSIELSILSVLKIIYYKLAVKVCSHNHHTQLVFVFSVVAIIFAMCFVVLSCCHQG